MLSDNNNVDQKLIEDKEKAVTFKNEANEHFISKFHIVAGSSFIQSLFLFILLVIIPIV